MAALEFSRRLHLLPADGALVAVLLQLLRRRHGEPAQGKCAKVTQQYLQIVQG